MRRTIFLVAICSAELATSAHALDLQKLDVQQLYEACSHKTADRDGMFCMGFMTAMLHTMRMFGGADDAGVRFSFGVCSKDPISYGAAIQSFLNWAEKHPEQWSKSMETGVIQALRETW